MGEVALAACGEDQWFEALDFLILNESRRSRIAREGRNVAHKHFSIETIAPRLGKELRIAAGLGESLALSLQHENGSSAHLSKSE